jgi:lipoprotein-releasing system permease protein
MNIILLFNISKTMLMARLKQSIIAAVGVTFGIMMFITMLSFMTGLNKLLDGLILNRTAHVRLYNEIKPTIEQPISFIQQTNDPVNIISSIKPVDRPQEIHNSLAIIENLKKDSNVIGIAPKLLTQVFYNVGSIDITGVINGIDVMAENKLFFFSDYLIKGNLEDLEHVSNSIILGKGAAQKMLVDVGDIVQVTTAKGSRHSLKVVGLFQVGIADIDNVQSYTSIQTAQKLLGVSKNYITDIQIKLTDLNQAPFLAKQYQKIYNTDALDIQTANSQFETGSSIRTLISYSVGITLLIVAGFGIYNILNMMIYEKMDSIAILKATGYSGKDVMKIFIFISLIIGITGGIVGLIGGFTLSTIISNIPFNTPSLPTVKTYPVNFNINYYYIGIIFSIITTFIAGFFPALKASKIDPVEIIRGK